MQLSAAPGSQKGMRDGFSLPGEAGLSAHGSTGQGPFVTPCWVEVTSPSGGVDIVLVRGSFSNSLGLGERGEARAGEAALEVVPEDMCVGGESPPSSKDASDTLSGLLASNQGSVPTGRSARFPGCCLGMSFLRLVSFTRCNYVPFPRECGKWHFSEKASWGAGPRWAGAQGVGAAVDMGWLLLGVHCGVSYVHPAVSLRPERCCHRGRWRKP